MAGIWVEDDEQDEERDEEPRDTFWEQVDRAIAEIRDGLWEGYR